MSYEIYRAIRTDIFKTITNIFGFNIIDFSQIELGYMNLKWKVNTDIGDLFVKQYNKTRYPEELIPGLENSLTHQSHLFNKGIPCPKLYTHKGNYVMKTPKGERFVLMSLCEGSNIKPGTANENQMYSLGRIVGQLHKTLNTNNANLFPLHWDIRSKESMIENWQDRKREAIRLKCNNTLSKLETQRKIIENCDIDTFAQCEKGWAHWDLFVDNILFKSNRVSAILDFDRMHYVYPEFDISRPLLSGCLENGKMHIDSVSAFVKGYREYQILTKEKLVRSIRLTWWKEAEWIQVRKTQTSFPLERFNEENNWVGENWDELDNLFVNI